MGRRYRKIQVTQEQFDAAEARRAKGPGRPKREGVPSLRPLGIGRAWLDALRAYLATLATAEARGFVRDVDALVAAAERRTTSQRERLAATLAERGPRVPKWHWHIERDAGAERSTQTVASIAEAAEALGITPGSFAVAMSKGNGTVQRAKGADTWITVRRVRPAESGTNLASEQNE